MNVRLIDDRILIQPDSHDTQTESGIILVGADDNPPTTGTVVAVGEKVEHLTAGDRVMFASYGGQDIELDGQQHVLMRPSDIYVVFED